MITDLNSRDVKVQGQHDPNNTYSMTESTNYWVCDEII